MIDIKEYYAYYLVEDDRICGGPFPTIESAAKGKELYTPKLCPFGVKIVKSMVRAMDV